MDNGVLIALISGAAVILAGIIGILPFLRNRKTSNQAADLVKHSSSIPLPEGDERRVFYNGNLLRFLNFGGKKSRVQAVDGGKSFLVPTHKLFHDKEAKTPVTRDSIVIQK